MELRKAEKFRKPKSKRNEISLPISAYQTGWQNRWNRTRKLIAECITSKTKSEKGRTEMKVMALVQ
jgi:hypothetical protein